MAIEIIDKTNAPTAVVRVVAPKRETVAQDILSRVRKKIKGKNFRRETFHPPPRRREGREKARKRENENEREREKEGLQRLAPFLDPLDGHEISLKTGIGSEEIGYNLNGDRSFKEHDAHSTELAVERRGREETGEREEEGEREREMIGVGAEYVVIHLAGFAQRKTQTQRERRERRFSAWGDSGGWTGLGTGQGPAERAAMGRARG